MSGKARRVIFGALIVVAWAVPGVSTPVVAESMSCTAEGDLVITPGLSTSPSSGTYGTDQPGTLNCKGGGKGTVEPAGKYGTKDPDTCSSGGEGAGKATFTFADGKTVVDDAIEFTYGPFQGGALGGSWKGSRSSGTFEVTSADGDCVTRPISKAHYVFRNLVVER
ncbi:MAG TPA: hypothetical protein VFW57_02245 [Acidimicrobiia bacterium]|nr:hypothetical protein [Acidimicrobiia bacterium]